MSPRESVAWELATTCRFGLLDEVYGINVARTVEGDKSYWAVTFCKREMLDGVVRVYSPRFILVKWQTRLQNTPHKGSARFDSIDSARKFITEKFIQPFV